MWIKKRSGLSFVNGITTVQATKGNHPVTRKPIYIFKVKGKSYSIDCALCYETT